MSQTPIRTLYEEAPDTLKDLVKHKLQIELRPPLETPRKTLIKEHESQIKLLSQGSVPIRNFILPLPYTPSRVSIEDPSCQKILLTDLTVEARDPGTFIILKTVTAPYIYSATIAIAEDESGSVTRLTLCNLEDTVIDPITPEGTVVAIKQPCWSRLVDGGSHIQVDHPSDIVVLKPGDTLTPKVWKKLDVLDTTKDATSWKKEGDMMFLKKRFRKALDYYTSGLEELKSDPNPASAIDLYRKKCGVHIVLLRLDAAAQDLSLAIAEHASSTPELATTPLSDYSTVNAWLHNNSTDDPLNIATQIPRALKELAARIKFDLGIFQTEPIYNLPLISSYVGPLTLHVDAANYLSDTEIRQTAKHGRGLFAKKSFKAGELVCAEKAFVMPGYFIQDRSSDCLLYSLGEETASPRPGALLFKELVQKLRWNPSLRKEYFELDDGGYWKEHGWEVKDGEEIPVDVFRIEKIRQLNCFSVPTRSLDLLSQPPNSNPELRNGFWIHASYVNHSCLPNTVRTFIGDVHFLRATRDIVAGEELTHQYMSPEIDIKDRQERYRGTWGFECDCKLCEVDGAVSEETRQLRLAKFGEMKDMAMKIGQTGTTKTSIKKIARNLRELETLYSLQGEPDLYAQLPRLALVHPSLFLVEAWRSVKSVDKMLEYADKLLRNFGLIAVARDGRFEIESNAGLINVEAVRALKYLAEGYTEIGEETLAQQCLAIAKSWFLIITGSEIGMEEFFKP